MQMLPQHTTSFIEQQLVLLLHYLYMHEYRFTTVSPATHQLVIERSDKNKNNSFTDIFGWNKAFQLESIDPDLVNLLNSSEILYEVDDGWKSLYRVSSLNDVLFYHSCYPTQDNDAVFFGPDTYRFANALSHFLTQNQQSIQTVVDIGTGSGVGACLAALALPHADVVGLDINHDALILARINAQAAGLEHINFMQSNLLHQVNGQFDLMIANPPYLHDESERVYRHGGGDLGSGLSLQIVDAAIERLNANGTLLLYTGVAIVDAHDAFLEAVTQNLEFAPVNFSYGEIDPDIFGEELAKPAYLDVDRIAAVVLTVRKHPI